MFAHPLPLPDPLALLATPLAARLGFGYGFGYCDSLSDCDSVSVSLSGLVFRLGQTLLVCSLLDCLLIWRADAYQLPFLLAFRLRRRRLLSTKKIHCLLLRARSKMLA